MDTAINVVYTYDDGYAAITAISIISLLEANKEVKDLRIYIVDYGIKADNKERIRRIIEGYGRSVSFVSPISVEERIPIQLDVKFWSPICYERLFYDELLVDCDKVLHIDCDTMVKENLQDLYNMDIDDVLVAACYDCTPRPKRQANMPDNYQYISNGILLLNLKKWREEQITKRCVKYIIDKKGVLPHLDQDVLSYAVQDSVIILPARFNVMPITFLYRELCCRLFKKTEPYYDSEQIKTACEQPAVIHFTGNPIIYRPWDQPCFHPYNSEWISLFTNSIYNDDKSIILERNRKYGKLKKVRSLLWTQFCKLAIGRKVLFTYEFNKKYRKYL